MAENVKKEFSEAIVCRHCGNKSCMEIVSRGSRLEVEYENGAPAYDYGFYCHVLHCPACENLTLRRAEEGPWIDMYDRASWEIVYPRNEVSLENLPADIQSAYDAACKVKGVDANFFAMGLRRVLEYVCKDKNASGRTLQDKLNNLAEQEIIPKTLAEMAHQLRALGNVGAHPELGELSPKEIPVLGDICRAILEYVYYAPALIAKVEGRLKELKAHDAAK